MYPILFQLGPLTIYSFGAFMALAALAAAWVVKCELKRRGYDPELASTLVFAAAFGGLVGARLLFIVEEWQGFLAAPMNYIFTGAGFTWYGGFFGGVAAVSWVLRKNKIPWLVGADMTVPALALAYGVGRLGCHFAGDGDWGAVTTVPWGVAYTKAIVGWADPTTGIPYASGRSSSIRRRSMSFSRVCSSLRFSGRCARKGLAAGTIAWLYLILAGLMRFIVEFWRINPSLGFGFSEAQWFSLLLVAVGVVMLVLRPARLAT